MAQKEEEDDEDREDAEGAAKSGPLDPLTLFGIATAISAAVLFIGLKLNKDVIYDVYWYVFGAAVAAVIAHGFGWIDLRRLQSAARPDPED
jgi:hypothetical protein